MKKPQNLRNIQITPGHCHKLPKVNLIRIGANGKLNKLVHKKVRSAAAIYEAHMPTKTILKNRVSIVPSGFFAMTIRIKKIGTRIIKVGETAAGIDRFALWPN